MIRSIDMNELSPAAADLLEDVLREGEVVITRGQEPVARIMPVSRPSRRGGFGSLRGQIWMADDFDAPLTDEFRDHVE